MTEYPDDRLYSPDHIWITSDGKVGVTPQLLSGLPKITGIHLPAVGDQVRVAEAFASLEGDKGTVDLYAPCDGAVLVRNDALVAAPDSVRDVPFESWLIVVSGEPRGLMRAQEYLRRAQRQSGA